MNASSTNTQILSRSRKILEFWHKVEFFIPFDLQKQVLESKGADWSVRHFTQTDLLQVTTKHLWSCDPPEGELIGFDLYIGVFDKSDLAIVTSKVIHEYPTDDEIIEQSERGDLEGVSCFSRIRVNCNGEILLDEISVSTVPWSLGRIQVTKNLDGLSFDAFQDGVLNLKEKLRNFQAQRINDRNSQVSKQPKDQKTSIESSSFPLTGSDILALTEVFYSWAGYQPITSGTSERAIVVVRAKSGKPSNKSAQPTLTSDISEEDDADTEDEPVEDTEIDILNSFYAKDIEKVINSIQAGEINTTLKNYLNPIEDDERIDLYTPKGRAFIMKSLFPSSINSGHWLDNKAHVMSMMQQFAIGRIFDSLQNGGVFSVNGPPGTGKTTLLRDIFAENITRRAKVLAGYAKSSEAFLSTKISVNFEEDNNTWRLSVLKPELAGYEMLVASSNNAAVENISRDLPKIDSIGTEWRNVPDGVGQAGYLQSVALKIAAQKSNGEFETLSPSDTPWGLISAALGNKGNRKAFVNKLRYPGVDAKRDYPFGLKEPYPKGFSPDKHKSIWQWITDYKGPSFTDAKAAYLRIDNSVKLRLKALNTLANLTQELKGNSKESFTQEAILTLKNSEKSHQEKESILQTLEIDLQLAEEQLESLRSLETLLNEQRPSWLSSILRKPSYLDYKKDLVDCRSKQGEQLRIKIDLKPKYETAKRDLGMASSNLQVAQGKLATCQKEWSHKSKKLEELQIEFPQATCPNDLDSLELNDWQKFGLWRDDTLNSLRSELFAAALQLHEAWLSEVLSKGGGFSPNVIALCNLLSGQRLQETQHALSIWQSLFMIVPVVSSTFASIANQFNHLGCNSLGWLFIDEAGQAIPQAAVGALWRSKRAVIVGDPLQIEPVFTVPIKLIEALFKSSGLSDDVQVMPHKVSAQTLSDLSNSFGTWIAGKDSQSQWIGSPLRVHRRCVEPMFSIANNIAYENKMIYGFESETPPKDTLNLGRSAWIDLAGTVSIKQVVPSQIELVLKAIVTLYQAHQKLPPLYIISPFKQIKNELVRTLSDIQRWQQISTTSVPTNTDLRSWCNTHIGTVHTFQGKENSIVWMVLGCDSQTLGAVSWASSKPNLLNVALTRAKHRFFMIGDIKIWSTRQYFSSTHKELEVISQEDFLNRMNAPHFMENVNSFE